MAERSGPRRRPVRRAAGAFGRFWWEFLIGDTPELFVGAVAVVAVVAVICLWPGLRTVATFVAPVLVAAVLTVSVALAARRSVP